jgi:alcohol dehydrogenase class IV
MNVDPTTLQGNWHYPTEVRFGPGRIGELADACRELGMARPLLVTDPGLSRLQMVADVLSANEAVGLPTTVFSGIRANPVAANISDGVDSYRAGACDGVIAFGGGSALDAGKAVALMVGQSRPIQDFEDREDWSERVHAPGMAPVVAVPTTAGTGSEVGRASVIGDRETRTKKIIFHPNMLPERVICDPELTLGLPAHLTAATGMDALAHCLEAFCAPGFHPMADGIALEGMRLIHRWLPKAVADGTNLTGRAHMMAAAAMGATSFQKGLGAIHALSHPIGAVFDTHHGLTNAVLMPYVLNFNRPAIEDRMVRLGRYLGLAQPSYDTVRDWILRLRDEIGIPNTLSEIGVASDRVEEIAELALADPSVAGNPLKLDEDGFRRLLREAMEG